MSQRQTKTPIHHEVGIPQKCWEITKNSLTKEISQHIIVI